MLKTAVVILALLPGPLAAQTPGVDPEAVKDLADLMRKARRNELYLIDEVAGTCMRVTSGLKQRQVIYFTTGGNDEPSHLTLDGRGSFGFRPDNWAGSDCALETAVEFEIESREGDTWTARYRSGYCTEAMVFLDNCSYTCHAYAKIDTERLRFALGADTARSLGAGSCRE